MVDRSSLRLVATTDNLRDGIDGLTARAAAACRGGATMVHLRLPDEEPRTVVAAARALVAALRVPVIVHGRADVALVGGAAGVHLGVRDIGSGEVRQLIGDDFIVGRSIGSESGDGVVSVGGADYVTVGPVFPAVQRHPDSALGLDGFRRIAGSVQVPVVAIGGISSTTAADVLRAGAAGVALISGIFGAADPEAAARALRAAIET